jgi:hypothetical protein
MYLELVISELEKSKNEIQKQWLSGKPFHYCYVDNFLPVEIAESLLASYPSVNQDNWTKTTYVHQRNKLHTQSGFSEPIQNFFDLTTAPKFLKLISEITSINNLIADPELFGGGVHQILPGGFLDVHIDYNIHPEKKLYRRLNLLLYLNKNWQREYEGYVELWDMENKKLVAEIAPVFNRAIMFETNEISYHGHPKPLKCPPPMTRKSLALYYYTKEREDEFRSVKEHNTIYKQTSGFQGYAKTFQSSCRSLVELLRKDGSEELCRQLVKKIGRKLRGLSNENK